MASVQLHGAFAALKGSVNKKSGLYYRTNKNGKVFTCAKPGATIEMILGQKPYVPPKRELTAAQKANLDKFKRVQLWKQEINNDPRKYGEYQLKYREYVKQVGKQKAKTFQGFLTALGYQLL